MRSIYLIGGSGFIGTTLARRLIFNGQSDVRILDKSPSRAYPDLARLCDVRSLTQLRESISEKSILINLAAEHRDDVSPSTLYDEVNVGGAKHLCIVAREKNIKKIVLMSSVAVYGFAPIGTDEAGKISPYNHYGRTKHEAEQVFREWQAEEPCERTLIIIRPTAVFGERNRGNIYNLFKWVASGKFVMIGKGTNCKSIAYVENLAAFIEYTLQFNPGIHVYNYIDKPDLSMNELVNKINHTLRRSNKSEYKLPYLAALLIGHCFDMFSLISRKPLLISSIRVKKFCANTIFNTSIDKMDFVPPIPLDEALKRTIEYEFLNPNQVDDVFYTE